MVLYQYYNADLLEIPVHEGEGEDAVDSRRLSDGDWERLPQCPPQAIRHGGVENWSRTHSPPLEYSKLALINFAHSRNKAESQIPHLPRRSVQPVGSTKYLGVVFDRNLNWKAQQVYAVEKGAKWEARIRRFTCPSWGITPKYAKRLDTSVALPRVLYVVDI
jgi:hypothetical protein